MIFFTGIFFIKFFLTHPTHVTQPRADQALLVYYIHYSHLIQPDNPTKPDHMIQKILHKIFFQKFYKKFFIQNIFIGNFS